MDSPLFAAVRLLALVADSSEAMPSPILAFQLRLHPSRVRQIQGQLCRAGLSTSRMGPGGGVTLARPAHGITLADVARAMHEPAKRERPALPVPLALYDVVETRLTAALSTITIADLLRDARLVVSQARRARFATLPTLGAAIPPAVRE